MRVGRLQEDLRPPRGNQRYCSPAHSREARRVQNRHAQRRHRLRVHLAAEADWAHCGSIEVGGRPRRLHAFVIVLSYSRMVYLEFTISEAMEEFLRCHQNAFRFFGGVPRAQKSPRNLIGANFRR